MPPADTDEGLVNLPAWAQLPHDREIAKLVATHLARSDQVTCVRAAVSAVRAVRDRMPDSPIEELAVDPAWLDAQLAALVSWLDGVAEADAVGGMIDVTRQTSAWRDFDVVDGWILEAVDFACCAVNVPAALVAAGYGRTHSEWAVLAAISATKALVCDGVPPRSAVAAIARATGALRAHADSPFR